MALFGKKKQIMSLEDRIAYLEANATPEFMAVESCKAELSDLQTAIDRAREDHARIKDEVHALSDEAHQLAVDIEAKRDELITLDDAVVIQQFGIYEPRYDFLTVDEYKARINSLRDRQKAIARELNEKAKNGSWTINGNVTAGRKFATNFQKLIIRSFNSEADETIRKVKFSNIDASVKAIRKSADTISKLCGSYGIGIPAEYVDLKVEEAYVSFEYAKFKEEEKERLRELKAQEREAKKLEKEIEAERKKLEKEQQQYSNALADVLAKIKTAKPEDLEALEAKKAELESNLEEVAKAVADVDYREANQKAGYVYIISNIGSFGEDVFKIGMTRRLDPMERVKELGDASVPFDFDVHALIFSDDAPGLEAALHHEFESRKLNLVNHRREFFKCSLDEIKSAVLANYDKTVEFVAVPDAEQFRISEKMRTGA